MMRLPSFVSQASSLTVVALLCFGCGGGSDSEGRKDPDPEHPAECLVDSDCDNAQFCDGEEQCDDGRCVTVNVPDCDDRIDCTTDSCNEATQGCDNIPPDVDEDGAYDRKCVDLDGNALGDDCDDDDNTRSPDFEEVCNPSDSSATVDEDCNPSTTGFFDLDGDGATDSACCNTDDLGRPLCGSDCDDHNIARFAEQVEFCDGIDNDCDGAKDEVENRIPWYKDKDEDGFGTSSKAGVVISCAPVSGYSHLGTDCDDGDPTINRTGTEICNGLDDNCNGLVDEGLVRCDTTETIPDALINECQDGTATCDASSETCIDQAIGFDCSCLAGFYATSDGCQDIEECKLDDRAGCDEVATCVEKIGKPSVCRCPVGYTTTDGGKTCDDINECETNNGGCGVGVECTNTVGSVLCGDCPPYFTGDGVNCEDVDECLTENGYCGDPAFFTCENQIGAPHICADIDECLVDAGGCGEFATCLNNEGGFSCPDINECQTDNGGCGDAQYFKCTNQTRMAPTCADINECSGATRTCDPLVTCVNNTGGPPNCGACPTGYLGDGATGCAPTLTGLALSSGALSPTFNSTVTDYTTLVPLTVESITLTSSVPAGANVTVNGVAVTPGEPSQAITLNLGANAIAVVVAQSGHPSSTYNITVTRGTQEAYIKASNTDANDNFGNSVSISGSTMVVGAPGESSNGSGEGNDAASSSGAAYVFIRSGAGVWTQQAYLKASNVGQGDNFGASVYVAGNRLVVGAPKEDSNANTVDGDEENDSAIDSGAAYVFVRSNGVWTQEAYLKGTQLRASDGFGASVGINGALVIVGARGDDSTGTGVNSTPSAWNRTNSGAAYIFGRTNNQWVEEAYLKSSGAQVNSDGFGVVAINGTTAVVGAPGLLGGAVEVFRKNNGTWDFERQLIASNTLGGEAFGASVDVKGSYIVVGAPAENRSSKGVGGNANIGNLANAGAAYIFFNDPAGWTQVAYVKSLHTAYDQRFGTSVALSGTVLVVGAPGDRSNTSGLGGALPGYGSGLDIGAAYVYSLTGTAPEGWTPIAHLKASNAATTHEFGSSVAIAGATIAVGGRYETSSSVGIDGDQFDTDAAGSGAVYIFR